MAHSQKGFTLLEMTVVLLIIGLLAGGVILGRSLVRGAEMRSVYKESGQYIEALKNFHDKYKSLPGDFATATTIWGEAHADPTTCKSTSSIKLTCNGDGNGRIITQGVDAGEVATHYEQFRAWQQLALAGMIEGAFTGVAGSGGSQERIPDENIPLSQLSGGGWGLVSVTAYDYVAALASTACLAIPYDVSDTSPNHVLWLGGRGDAGSCNEQVPVLTGLEALTIDKKIDDGFPASGKILAQTNSSGALCTDSGAYDVDSENFTCALVFKTGF